MSRFTAPNGTEVSTTGPGGEEMRVEFSKGSRGREGRGTGGRVLGRLADDKANAVGRARKAKED